MCGIKIEFALKMQGGGGLCTRGGVFVGHCGTCTTIGLYICVNTHIAQQKHGVD